MITVIPAGRQHLDAIVPLFDAYRKFYGQPSDPSAARSFLADRMAAGDSVLFLATNEDQVPLGFSQLYPSYSSVSLRRLWILNDLFVDPAHRTMGIAAALLERCVLHSRETQARGLVLETAVTNTAARRLYERLGWVRETDFLTYRFDTGG